MASERVYITDRTGMLAQNLDHLDGDGGFRKNALVVFAAYRNKIGSLAFIALRRKPNIFMRELHV
jgi:hypothetical protein